MKIDYYWDSEYRNVWYSTHYTRLKQFCPRWPAYGNRFPPVRMCGNDLYADAIHFYAAAVRGRTIRVHTTLVLPENVRATRLWFRQRAR